MKPAVGDLLKLGCFGGQTDFFQLLTLCVCLPSPPFPSLLSSKHSYLIQTLSVLDAPSVAKHCRRFADRSLGWLFLTQMKSQVSLFRGRLHQQF